MVANGKAELYFHAYFWTTYLKRLFDVNPDLKNCIEVKRMENLATKPRQVIEIISRNQFKEKEYLKFVEEFGNKKNTNRTKLIEQL